jgi:hypothetical protein
MGATRKKNATQPKIGDECWIVEWCIKAGLVDEEHPEYGGDPDLDVHRNRRVATREQAEATAREVYPQDQHGAIRYWPARFVPYDEDDADLYPGVGYWDEIGEYEFYEGDDDGDG